MIDFLLPLCYTWHSGAFGFGVRLLVVKNENKEKKVMKN
jgi:hypothetical protein